MAADRSGDRAAAAVALPARRARQLRSYLDRAPESRAKALLRESVMTIEARPAGEWRTAARGSRQCRFEPGPGKGSLVCGEPRPGCSRSLTRRLPRSTPAVRNRATPRRSIAPAAPRSGSSTSASKPARDRGPVPAQRRRSGSRSAQPGDRGRPRRRLAAPCRRDRRLPPLPGPRVYRRDRRKDWSSRSTATWSSACWPRTSSAGWKRCSRPSWPPSRSGDGGRTRTIKRNQE